MVPPPESANGLTPKETPERNSRKKLPTTWAGRYTPIVRSKALGLALAFTLRTYALLLSDL